MNRIIYLLLFIALLASCKKSSYQLKWKPIANDRLIYKIDMEILKDESKVTKAFDFSGMVKTLNKIKGDTTKVPDFNMKDSYNLILEMQNSMQFFSILEQKDSINLDVISKRKIYNFKKNNLFENVWPDQINFFSGYISKDGSIKSSKGEFINYLVNLLFELPHKPVNIGDSWSIDIQMYTFKDKNSMNSVKLKDIIKAGKFC